MSYNAAFTAKRKAEFLENIKNGQSVCQAALPLLTTRRTIYLHRTKDPKFAAAWDRALEDGVDKLEDEARRRAYEGVDEPVFHRGKQCGIIKRYSDTLLIFLLKGSRPEKYRDTAEIVPGATRSLNLNVYLGAASGSSAGTAPLQSIDNNGTYEVTLDAHSSVEGQADATPTTLRVIGEGRVGGERDSLPSLPNSDSSEER